jgi:hypothetical protein
MGFQNLFGSTSSSSGLVDLTNYYTKSEADALLTAKANLTGGKHVAGEVTDLAITTVHTVTNNTQRDALVTGGNIQAGDVVIVTDTQVTWIYNGSGYQQIDSTEVSWDNVKSSANKSATTKFGELDTAIAAKVTATGTSGNWKFLNQGSNNTTQYREIDIKSAGGTGTSLIALDGYANDGGTLNSNRSAAMGGTTNVGHYVLKNFNAPAPLSHQLSGNDQTLQIGFAQTSSSDNNKFLKYVHGGVPIWDTPAGSGGGSSTFTGLTDTPSGITANQAIRGNSAGNGLEFYNPVLVDAASVSNQVSLKGTGHGPTSNDIKVLKAGTGVTLTTPEDPNCIQINSTATGGASINDGSISSSTVYSSSKIDSTYLQQSKVKNSTSTTAGDVYDVRHVDSQLAGKANTSHTHVIADVTNLQTSLDGKLSTNVNTLGSGGTSLHIVSGTQLGLKRLNAGSNVTIGESNGDITIAAAAEVNDATSGATTTYSSNKIINDYLPYSNVHSSTRSGANEVYNAPYVNTQLGNKLATSVSNLGASGIQLHSVTGQALSLKTLAGAGLASVTESGGIITVTGNADTNKADVTYVNSQLANVINDATSSTTTTYSSTKITAIENNLISRMDYSINTNLNLKLSLTGGALTGHVTTNQSTFNSNDQIVNKQYVDTSISNLVDSAPATLNTLNELAAALGDDANFSTTVTNSIAAKLPLAGGALTGNVTTNLANNAFTATSLVSRNYVDNAVGGAGGATTFTALTDTPSTFTNDRFLKTTGSAVVDFELNSKTLKWDFYNAVADLPTASSNHGMLAHVHAEGAVYFAHNGNWVKLANSILPNGSFHQDTRLTFNAPSNATAFLASVDFNGPNSASASTTYSYISSYITANTANSENGALYISTKMNGTDTFVVKYNSSVYNAKPVTYYYGLIDATQGVRYADSKVQTKAVEDPATVGHVLTATAGGNWAWQAASGGSSGPTIPNSKKIDQLKLSGNTITAEDGTTSYNAYGILWGDRYMTYVIDNTFVRNRNDAAEYEINHLHNGYRATGFSPFDDPPDQYRAGGHVIWQHQDGLYLKLNALHFHYWNNGNPNMTMAFYGSNDRVTWTKLTEWNHNDATAYSNGYATTSYTIDGTSVSIPARGPSNLTKTVYNGATALTNTNNSTGCRRYVFNNTNFYMFYMLKNIAANQHPNMSATHSVSMDSQLEWEY